MAEEEKKLEVRLMRGKWHCSCGGEVFYIDPEDMPRRRMQCMNKHCDFEVRSVT